MRVSQSTTPNATNNPPVTLSQNLDQRLRGYVAAAAAAGVGVLALGQSAEAKVVYTPANRSIVADSRLDLNNDQIPDYAFHSNFNICGTCGYFEAQGLKFNRMMSAGDPLEAGISVGPGGKFNVGGIMVDFCTCSGNPNTGGPWLGIQNEYMGFEFNIQGAAHFGWARFSVTEKGAITLTGYAYETISLKPIVTGDEGGGGDEDAFTGASPAATIPAERSAALGTLALGSGGLTALRKQ